MNPGWRRGEVIGAPPSDMTKALEMESALESAARISFRDGGQFLPRVLLGFTVGGWGGSLTEMRWLQNGTRGSRGCEDGFNSKQYRRENGPGPLAGQVVVKATWEWDPRGITRSDSDGVGSALGRIDAEAIVVFLKSVCLGDKKKEKLIASECRLNGFDINWGRGSRVVTPWWMKCVASESNGEPGLAVQRSVNQTAQTAKWVSRSKSYTLRCSPHRCAALTGPRLSDRRAPEQWTRADFHPQIRIFFYLNMSGGFNQTKLALQRRKEKKILDHRTKYSRGYMRDGI